MQNKEIVFEYSTLNVDFCIVGIDESVPVKEEVTTTLFGKSRGQAVNEIKSD